jgi:hypothetical protein
MSDDTAAITAERDRNYPPEPGQAAPRNGMVTFALAMTYIASATTAWNGWKIGVRPGDIFLFLAVLTFFLADLGHRFPRLPRWVWTFGAIILVVTALHEFFPTDPNYFSRRLVIGLNNTILHGNVEILPNLAVGLKFLVPIVGLPLMYAFAYMHDRRALWRGAYSFAIGAAISGFVAFSDRFAGTQFSKSLTGIPAVGGRAPGLTLHPNFLATTCVLGLPFMLWQILAPRLRDRALALIVLFPLVIGLYAAGSRGGAAVGAGTILVSFAVMPRYRRILPTVTILTLGIGALAFVLKPSIGTALLKAVRLKNNGSASGSNTARDLVGHQGVLDFKHSPFDGVGMQVAAEAHNVYLQALAAGGLLLFSGYAIYVLCALWTGYQHALKAEWAYPFAIAALSGGMLAYVESALTDRLAYVPLALIAAMPMRNAITGEVTPDPRRERDLESIPLPPVAPRMSRV